MRLGVVCAAVFFSLMLPAAAGPVKIIFDTDMGSDADDVGALALLHHYADLGIAEILACVYSSGKVPYGAAVIEAINVYYGRPHIPIGANHHDDVGDPDDKMDAEKLARDTAAFGHRIIHNRDAPDQTRLTRKLLAAQEDGSVVYLTVGHTKGLYDLLVSKADEVSGLDGAELIQKKVARWVALGALGANNQAGRYVKDWNFFFNGAAPYTEYLVKNFPAPAVFVDAGTDVMTGRSLKDTPSGNIVRTAYRDWLWKVEKKTLDDQRPSWDLAAVYYAVEGAGDYLVDEGNGRLDFDQERGCRWQGGPGEPPQTFISQKEGVAEAFADYLNQRIAMAPER
jgi:hypothetical protein